MILTRPENFPLFLLLFGNVIFGIFGSRNSGKQNRHTPHAVAFQFTSANYNVSIYENSLNGIAQLDYGKLWSDVEKMGVHIPNGYNQISFRIVEVSLQL